METRVKKRGIVGTFIREKRESLNLSQKALGQIFEPPVTTQFISNLERGVTPLPPAHVPTLAKALGIAQDALMILLEKEYAAKLNSRLGRADSPVLPNGHAGAHDGSSALSVAPEHLDLMKRIYDAYQKADPQMQAQLRSLCDQVLSSPTQKPA